MSKEIEILDGFPVILTKQADWKPRTVAKEGAIIVLPDDAVLVAIPRTLEVVSGLVGEQPLANTDTANKPPKEQP